ncbi:MAG: ATP-binding protein, partial [Pseudomonadota bacterium]
MRSLSGRLLLAVSLLLAVFFGITIVLLDSAFRASAEQAIRDRLDVQLVVLLAGAEPTASQPPSLLIADALPEARFETPGSGLYGQITDAMGATLWRSPSAVGSGIGQIASLGAGERRFVRTQTLDGEEVFALSLGVVWEFVDDQGTSFVFTAAEHLRPFQREVDGFRQALFGWFALLMVLLLAGQAVALRLLLRPLRRVQEEIASIEQGETASLSADYPRELHGVTANLNALIAGERERLSRYRDTLGNLAHSLKTPLAVMRNAVGADGEGTPQVLQEQLDHMQQMVSYQLQRAAAWGATSLGAKPVPVAPVAQRLQRSLVKVYAEKDVRLEAEVDEDAVFFGDEGDLMEVLGNLLDNGCKWCESSVVLQVRSVPVDQERRRRGVRLIVADDGPGIDPEQAERLTERGVRADERVAGNACVACDPGTVNAPGDDASMADTTCDAVLCGINER